MRKTLKILLLAVMLLVMVGMTMLITSAENDILIVLCISAFTAFSGDPFASLNKEM